MSSTEPEWDETQLALILAADRLEADIGPHGQPISEALSPLANPDVPEGWHYKAVGPVIDYAQQRLDRARSAYEKNYPDADTTGHVWRVERVDS